MTLREEILKNSGVLSEMSIKRVENIQEIIDTPIGTFEIRCDEDDFDINEYGDFNYIYSYIAESDILGWRPNLMAGFAVGFGKDSEGKHAKVFYKEEAAKILDLLAEKLPVGMFDDGIKKCEEQLKTWKEKLGDSEFSRREWPKKFEDILERFKKKHNNSTRRY